MVAVYVFVQDLQLKQVGFVYCFGKLNNNAMAKDLSEVIDLLIGNMPLLHLINYIPKLDLRAGHNVCMRFIRDVQRFILINCL